MNSFESPDGTLLVYDVAGEGEPLLVLPGGPILHPDYLGDLGGLAAHRALHFLHLRGTVGSDVPSDPSSYRCDRQVDDVEAFRTHLGADRVDLFAHSAGASLAILYAIQHSRRIRTLVLVTPSLRPFGWTPSEERLREAAQRRAGEPWFDEAMNALEAVIAGTATQADWAAITPFSHGRWDDDARAHVASEADMRNHDAAKIYYADGVFDPPVTKEDLAGLSTPTLVVAGALDINPVPDAARDIAAQFPDGSSAVVPGGGHFPWRDDADTFVRTVTSFLDARSAYSSG